MTSSHIRTRIQKGKVVVEYNDKEIKRLSPGDAIECGGKIAEIGRKLLKEGAGTTEEKDQTSTDAIDIMKATEISQDEVYVGEIDRISSSGNALVELPSTISRNHVNLGPIDESAVGNKVEFRYSGGSWAECLTQEYTYESYEARDGQSTSSTSTRSRHPFNGGNSNTSPSDPDNKNELINGHL